MLSPKPLRRLLDEADALIGATGGSASIKQASARSDEVAALVESLAKAAHVLPETPTASEQDEIDRVALSMNRLQAAAETDTFHKVAAFEQKARAEGYSDEQIGEALHKVASGRLAESLPFVAALYLNGKHEASGR